MPPTTPKRLSVSAALQLALDHHGAGRIPEAEAIYRQILAADPRHPHALHLLGLLAYQAGNLTKAMELIEAAIQSRGDVPDFHANLGEAFRAAGNLERAIACHREAVRLEPALPEIRLSLANALADAGQPEAAAEQYRQAALAAGGDAGAIRRMADGLERMNRLEGARQLLDQGLAAAPDHPELNLLAAKVDRREGAFQQGIERLERLAGQEMALATSIALLTQLGMLYDRTDRADEAFQAFEAAGRRKAERYLSQGIAKEPGLEEIEATRTALTKEWLTRWRKGPTTGFARPAPVFLVGFPRSGTTLLEQVLASHSGIATLEEKPVVEMLVEQVRRQPGGYPGGLANLSTQTIAGLRNGYFQRVDQLVSVAPGQLLIDKFPLNIVRLPLVARIFPDARYILALRHPADTVLSGFMQNFSPNSAMANFCAIDDAARFYDRVMGLWRQSSELLGVNFHPIKYEALVEDFDGEVAKLLGFLGLPWEEGVRDYRETARKGKKIGTPSYHQVAEPIYHRAKERWRRYEGHLKPIEPTLAPWVEYFGYRQV